jgi:YVTN family beta-propeller protein
MRNERWAWLVRVGVALIGACALMMVVAGAAWSASGWTAYVANYGANSVMPIHTALNTVGMPIPVGTRPQGIAITPDGKTAYVTNLGDSTVTPINIATNTMGTAIPVGTGPEGVAVTPDGKTAYVANAGSAIVHGNSVTPISTATNVPQTPITVGNSPFAIGITPDGKTAYVTNFSDNTVTPIDVASSLAEPAITVGQFPDAVAITPDGKTAYVTNFGDNTVTPISTVSNAPGTPIPVGREPEAIAITPNGKTAYVANNLDATVTPINLASNTPGIAIAAGTAPAALAITPDGVTAYVTDFGGSTVTPISTTTNTRGPTITVGANPAAVAITPDQAPTAAFSLAAAPVGSSSSFDGSGSLSPVGTIASYHWDFGDGQSATTTTPLVTHVYATSGSYTAGLTVTNTAGTSLTQVFTGQTVSQQGGPQASTTHPVTVAPTPTPPPPGPVAPTLTRVAESHPLWREGNRLATFAKSKRKKPPLGTTFSFALNERARVSFAFTQRAAGRKIKGRCVAQTNKNRQKPSCKRTLIQGTLAFTGHAGLNGISFQGRISRTKKLKPGAYTLAITATNTAAQHSTTKTLSFTIVK